MNRHEHDSADGNPYAALEARPAAFAIVPAPLNHNGWAAITGFRRVRVRRARGGTGIEEDRAAAVLLRDREWH